MDPVSSVPDCDGLSVRAPILPRSMPRSTVNYAEYRNLKFSQTDAVLTVSLNRPDKLNAIDAALHFELASVFHDVARDYSVNVVILTGEGRAFSAGGDLSWFRDMTPAELDRLFIEARQIIIDFLEVPQPIISAIQGGAHGLGATLALLSDISIAAEGIEISDPHVRIGVGAGDGGAIIWPWLIGPGRAKEFLMTGDSVSAADAARMGLVNHVVPDTELLATATRLAVRLAAGPQMAIRATKASVNKVLRDTVNLVLDTSLSLEKECFRSQDHREAVNAFLEKRNPRFGQ
jgi:enoyl-CoA hydratase